MVILHKIILQKIKILRVRNSEDTSYTPRTTSISKSVNNRQTMHDNGSQNYSPEYVMGDNDQKKDKMY